MEISLDDPRSDTVGVTLPVIGPRWVRPIGTIARVTDIGLHVIGKEWCFTVDWLTYLPKRSMRSLRLSEDDLPTFEILTGPVEIPVYHRPTTRDLFKFKPESPQLSLHFVETLQP